LDAFPWFSFLFRSGSLSIRHPFIGLMIRPARNRKDHFEEDPGENHR
jgi:hypothetical protein